MNETSIVEVDLDDRSYPIYIGDTLLARKELFEPHIVGNQVMIVSNSTIAPIYQDFLIESLSSYQINTFSFPDGEKFKNTDTLNSLYSNLLENKFERNCTIIALGGGVVGDIVGFAAATYLRGVNFIQVPTTLLSQVDSSVGGKTGINHPLGKNMIGAFYQPQAVIADISVLRTLPEREFSAGLAEIIKYGLINDIKFFHWLENTIEKIMDRDSFSLIQAIERSCKNKTDIVENDEKEIGKRALLNLGHTFGHAIETGMGYGEWLHGEAISAGMIMALEMSVRLGWIDQEIKQRILTLFKSANLPIEPPNSINQDHFLSLMSHDKKVLDGNIRLILLKNIGEAVISDDYPQDVFLDTLGHFFN